jgi:hypothetical protein
LLERAAISYISLASAALTGTSRSGVFSVVISREPIKGNTWVSRLLRVFSLCDSDHFLLLLCHCRAIVSKVWVISGTDFFARFCSQGQYLRLFASWHYPASLWPLTMRCPDTHQEQAFFFAKEAIAEAPVAGTIGMNKQKHIAAVSEFIRFFIRFSCTDFSVSERHW